MPRAVDERHVSHEEHRASAEFAFQGIRLLTAIRSEALRRWAFEALKQFGVGITQLDGDVSDFLFLVLDRLIPLGRVFTYVDSGDGLHKGRLSVRDMANRPNVLGGLPRDDLRR